MRMFEEVAIESLGSQGDGVTASGVFVPFALPGEVVRMTVQGHRAKLETVIKEAAERIAPVCPHYGECGGCTLQHAAGGLVAGWKRTVIQQSLAQRGITDVDIRPVETSPAATRRRVTVTARRTKKSALIGFHAAGSDQIIPIETCSVADPAIAELLPRLEELVTAGASRKGELRITITTSDAGLDVAVTGGKPVEGPLYGQLVAVAATSDMARLSWDGDVIVTRRPPGQIMGKARVLPPPGGFLQATLHGEQVLVEAAQQAVGDAALIADLFAGSGTFSLPLSEQAEVSRHRS